MDFQIPIVLLIIAVVHICNFGPNTVRNGNTSKNNETHTMDSPSDKDSKNMILIGEMPELLGNCSWKRWRKTEKCGNGIVMQV